MLRSLAGFVDVFLPWFYLWHQLPDRPWSVLKSPAPGQLIAQFSGPLSAS